MIGGEGEGEGEGQWQSQPERSARRELYPYMVGMENSMCVPVRVHRANYFSIMFSKLVLTFHFN